MGVAANLVLAAWMLACAGGLQDAQKPANGGAESSKPAAAAKPSGANGVSEEEYKIGAQDVLRIDVWKETELTRTVPVRPDGKISLPLLNDVQAAGLTPSQLAGVLTEGLKKFINAPQVTVTVSEINSRRVYVTGEVAHAGAFPLLPNMTVLQALSSSGGFSQFAKTKAIYVLRLEDGKQVKHPFNYREVLAGRNQEQNIALLPGDVIVVP
ncbi:MAG TPA: polysaccharide biosynthesis/export family protein [Candidatus Acidoferrum sp.]|nr:polysaccharide biosynthesis/export family protein [Candidatus Acidoferrum sp.]